VCDSKIPVTLIPGGFYKSKFRMLDIREEKLSAAIVISARYVSENIFLFKCRQNFQLGCAVVCYHLILEKPPISWHLSEQEGGSKDNNE
jgi:hypothetical protein